MFKKNILIKIIVFIYVLFALIFVNKGVTFFYHFADAIFILSFLIVFFLKKNKIQLSIYFKVISVFSVYLILSYLWSPVSGELLYKNLLLQGSLLLNSLVLFNFIRNYDLLKIIGYSYFFYVLINILIFLGLISSSFFAPLEDSSQLFELARFKGVSNNSNLLAMELFFASFVLLYLKRDEENRLIKWLYTIAPFFIFIMIIATGSKKGILSFLLIQLFNFYLIPKNKQKNFNYYLTKILIIISPVIIIYIYVNYIKDSLLMERFLMAFEALGSGSGDESTEVRMNLYDLAYKGILDSPIIGNGMDSFSYYHYYYTHSNYLEILFNLGIIGFIVYFRLYLYIFRLIKKSKELKSLNLFLLFILLFVDFTLVSYNLRSYMIFFTFLNIMLLKKK